jgi:hypothetical protein
MLTTALRLSGCIPARRAIVMPTESNIPAVWIGAEELPVHFANVFGATAGPHAVFLLAGSMVPAEVEDGLSAPYVPVKPIAKLAIAPAAVPQLIQLLTKAHEAQKAQANAQGQ